MLFYSNCNELIIIDMYTNSAMRVELWIDEKNMKQYIDKHKDAELNKENPNCKIIEEGRFVWNLNNIIGKYIVKMSDYQNDVSEGSIGAAVFQKIRDHI